VTDELRQAAVKTWAARNLPARLDVAATAKLLGFAEHDVQVLMEAGRLVRWVILRQMPKKVPHGRVH
jgi:hypothetical protein